MDCKTFSKWIQKDPSDWYLDVKHAMLEHKESCADCNRLWEGLEAFELAVKQDRNIEIPSTVDTDLWAEVFTDIQKPAKQKRNFYRPAFGFRPALAWGLSTALAVFMLFTYVNRGSMSKNDTEMPDIVVESATVNDRDAQIMTFHFDNPKISVIWIE